MSIPRPLVFCLISLLSFFAFVFHARAAYALASLQFDGTAKTGNVGGVISVPININTGQDAVVSADVYVLFDPVYLEVQNITAGAFFQNVYNTLTSSSKLYIGGLQDSTQQARSGTGQVAVINFLAKQAGQATLRFDCQTGVAQTSKVIANDTNKTNIIDCSSTAAQTQNVIITAATPGVTTTDTGSSGAPGTTGTAGFFAPSTGTTTSAPGRTTTVTTLPQSGVFENVVKYVVPGFIFVGLGYLIHRSVNIW
jgi:hypothetical protein